MALGPLRIADFDDTTLGRAQALADAVELALVDFLAAYRQRASTSAGEGE